MIIAKFQSTRPRGARHYIVIRKDERGGVSIHAPAGGATELDGVPTLIDFSFNPRARGGRDVFFSSPPPELDGFNPRARGGRDKGRRKNESKKQCFNPRARGGRDLRRQVDKLAQHLFQSTRPRGARRISS